MVGFLAGYPPGGQTVFEAGAELVALENSPTHPTAAEWSFGIRVAQSDGHQKMGLRRLESAAPRRTPRRSVIVVLTENHTIRADLIDARLPSEADRDNVDVIVACAGQPRAIGSLPSRLSDVQLVLAPAGTSGEDLRQLAMEHAAGDIITLVSGIPV